MKGIRSVVVLEWEASGLLPGSFKLGWLWGRVSEAGGLTGAPNEVDLEVSVGPEAARLPAAGAAVQGCACKYAHGT